MPGGCSRDTGPLRESPDFRRLWAGTALSAVGGALTMCITADLLGELLPLGRKLHPAAVRRAVHAVADPPAPTSCSRSVPGSSTTSSLATSTAGTPGFNQAPDLVALAA